MTSTETAPQLISVSQCQRCQGKQFARIEDAKGNPTNSLRCVECKIVYTLETSATLSPEPAQDVTPVGYAGKTSLDALRNHSASSAELLSLPDIGLEYVPLYSQEAITKLEKQIDELKIQTCAPREQREFDLARAADKETFDAALAKLEAERDAAILAAKQNHKQGTEFLDRALKAEASLADMQRERYELAYAICGGEDAPGLLDSLSVEEIVKIQTDNIEFKHDNIIAPLCWVYEDELPESMTKEAYNALYPHSKVDAVRLFPVYGPESYTLTACQKREAGLREIEALPCDVKVNATVFRKGVKLDTLIGALLRAATLNREGA